MGAYDARVIADGATNYWRLNEPSGTTAVDVVGGANGTISGGVTLAQPGGVPGDTAMTFDGSTGKVVTAANVTLPLICTIEFWLKTTWIGSAGQYRFIFSTRGSGTGNDVYIALYNNAGTVRLQCGSAAANDDVRQFNDGQWHHTVIVFNAPQLTFYLDGSNPNSTTNARTVLNQGLAAIGWDAVFGGTPTYWLGSLDDIAIYPRALTAPEVAAHYAAAAASTGGVRTLSFGYWKQQWPAA